MTDPPLNNWVRWVNYQFYWCTGFYWVPQQGSTGFALGYRKHEICPSPDVVPHHHPAGVPDLAADRDLQCALPTDTRAERTVCMSRSVCLRAACVRVRACAWVGGRAGGRAGGCFCFCFRFRFGGSPILGHTQLKRATCSIRITFGRARRLEDSL